MNTDSPDSPPSPEQAEPSPIVDTNGVPVHGPLPELILPDGVAENPNHEQAEEGGEAEEKVVEMPQPDLVRSCRVVETPEGKLGVHLWFETNLRRDRLNLLVARIYAQAHNAEREVNRMDHKAVKQIVKNFNESRRG